MSRPRTQPTPPAPSHLMTPAEVAEVFRVDYRTTQRWANAGLLRVVRTLGGHRRYYRDEVKAIIDGRDAVAFAEVEALLGDALATEEPS